MPPIFLVLPLLAVQPGGIDTYAGRPQAGTAGDGKLAKEAALVEPFHCDLDAQGNLFIADAPAHRIRRVDRASGLMSTVAGIGEAGSKGDGGPATSASINSPYAVAVDLDGDLYLVEQKGLVVRKVDGRSGVITRVAGGGTGDGAKDGIPAIEARFREPNDLCLDGKGGLLIADVGDGRIRRVDLKTGLIATFAGTGKPSGKPDRSRIGDGGPAKSAVIVGARAVCVDGRGNTYIAEREGNALRRVDAGGTITSIAGTGESGYSGDGGPARLATFRGPKAIRCGPDGDVYVVDTENHAVRRIAVKDGTITTIAGGREGPGGDDGPATEAGLARPHGCAIDPAGILYIADSENHRVRRVLPR